MNKEISPKMPSELLEEEAKEELEEIKEFCSSNFNVDFPIFEKVHAKGNTTNIIKTPMN